MWQHGALSKVGKTISGLFLALSVGLMPQAVSGADMLAGSEWGPEGQGSVFVRFEGGGKLAGNGGCNRFFGQYRLGDDGAIKNGPLGAMRKHCGDVVMEIETGFLAALEAAVRCERTTGRLRCYGPAGEQLLDLVHRDWD